MTPTQRSICFIIFPTANSIPHLNSSVFWARFAINNTSLFNSLRMLFRVRVVFGYETVTKKPWKLTKKSVVKLLPMHFLSCHKYACKELTCHLLAIVFSIYESLVEASNWYASYFRDLLELTFLAISRTIL